MQDELFQTPASETAPAIKDPWGPECPEAETILKELRRKPQACDHVADSLGYPLDVTRKVMANLQKAGLIVDLQDRIKTPSYKQSVVWHPTKL